MRTFGRIFAEDGTYTWAEVSTDAQGFNDNVYLTALCQCLQLNLGESPFYSDWGIPARRSVITQVFPDFYVLLTQQRFAPLFASLTITRVPNVASPQYQIRAVGHSGALLTAEVAV